jgi:uncharacterized membrane protein (UPF0127 family)
MPSLHCLRLRFVHCAHLAWTILVLALLGCARGPCVNIVGQDGKSLASVTVEVADNDQSREKGLMFRNQLDADAGMLFIFRQPSKLVFWMRNTWIPLDMIFADGNGRIVGIVANARTRSDQQLGVDAESQYVLEVNGGFSEKHHIKAGDRLEFQGFLPHASQ